MKCQCKFRTSAFLIAKIFQQNKFSNKDLIHTSKKRKLSELNLCNENAKKPKLFNDKFDFQGAKNFVKTEKNKIILNFSFIFSFSRNGSFKSELITLCKTLSEYSIEIIVFDRSFMLGVDIILDSNNCCLVLSSEELSDEFVTIDDNKYDKIINTIKQNLLKYKFLYILLTTNSRYLHNNLAK